MKYVRLGIGLLISLASLFLLARDVQPERVAAALSQADPLWLLVCLVTVPASILMKALRWRLLLAPARTPLGGLHAALYVGYLVSTIVPLRLGELARVYLAGEQSALAWARVLATVFVEKLLDVGVLVLFLAVLLVVAPLPEWAQAAALPSAAAIVVGLAGLGVGVALGDRLVAPVRWLEDRLPFLGRLGASGHAVQFLAGTSAMRQPLLLVGTVAWSLVIWGLAILTVHAAVRAPGIEAPLAASVLALVVTNLGMAVPSAPAYIGVFEGLIVLALGVFGVDLSEALGAAIILRVCVYGWFLVGGLVALWQSNLALGRVFSGASGVLARSQHD